MKKVVRTPFRGLPDPDHISTAYVEWNDLTMRMSIRRFTRLAPTKVLPKKWPGNRFDMVWVFDLNAQDEYDFAQVPELVLPTDDSAPMK